MIGSCWGISLRKPNFTAYSALRSIRFFLVCTVLLFAAGGLHAQPYYPVKLNKQWGLMNESGSVIIPPSYDVIEEYNDFDYAVMQKDGHVGVLSREGEEIVAPIYEDLKVLDKQLFAVMEGGGWKVINMRGYIVLESGYEKVKVMDSGYLAYLKMGKWGIIDFKGKSICLPIYESVELFEKDFFLVTSKNNKGLLSKSGEIVLPTDYHEIRYDQQHEIIFFLQDHFWGACYKDGRFLFEPRFLKYEFIADNFIKLYHNNGLGLYSITAGELITSAPYDNFYPFSAQKVLVKRNRAMGLMEASGQFILPIKYEEILSFGDSLYRVKSNGRWGIVENSGAFILNFNYDYITPLTYQVGVIMKNNQYGITNCKGDLLVPAIYDKVEVEEKHIKAFKENALTLFHINNQGELVSEEEYKEYLTIKVRRKENAGSYKFTINEENQYLLDHFEWFYSSQMDKWGLRNLMDGSIQIRPTFDWVKVDKTLGFTLVGIEKFANYSLDRTSYRFEMQYGIVNNEKGLLVSELNIWDVRLEDFAKGLPLARCILTDGRHGLINKWGNIVQKGFVYMGEFKNGLARFGVEGRLAGTFTNNERTLGKVGHYLESILSPYVMVDYTRHDRDFDRDAYLTCEDCQWGYIDTLGEIIIPAQYDFGKDFSNGVGMVMQQSKWGVIGLSGEQLIPLQFDYIDFLENTEQRILRISTKNTKYGLIDTLGQMTVGTMYDEIGAFIEGRLAVKKGGKWGFANDKGEEIIPCQYRRIRNFSNGVAAVEKGVKWGYVDSNGRTMIDCKYIRAGNYNNGLIWVSTGQGFGYVNIHDEMVIEPQFSKAFDFEGKVARVVEDGKYGLIDKTGTYIVKPGKYTLIDPFNELGLAKVRYGNDKFRYGLINKEGQLVTNQGYRKIGDFYEGLALVKTADNHFGFIDTNGKMVINAIYSDASDFSEGRAAVQQDGYCGYIDKTGNVVVPIQYTQCLDFKDQRAVVYESHQKAGLIDLNGEFIIEPSINTLISFNNGRGLVKDPDYQFYYITESAEMADGYFADAESYEHGVAVVQIDGKWGIINQRGLELIKPKYDEIGEFESGYAKVRVQEFNGLANLHGDLIVEPTYEYIRYAGSGLFRVEQGDKIGYFNDNGRWIWELQN